MAPKTDRFLDVSCESFTGITNLRVKQEFKFLEHVFKKLSSYGKRAIFVWSGNIVQLIY